MGFAAPIVAGIIAQMLEYNPSLSATGVWNLLDNWSETLSNSTDPQSIGSIKFVRARPCNP